MNPGELQQLLLFISCSAAVVVGLAFLIALIALPFWVNSIRSDMKLVIQYLEIFRKEMAKRATSSGNTAP